MDLEFFNQDCELKLQNKDKLALWIEQTTVEEGKEADAISVIFCSDEYLLDVNVKFLNHDYYTDIITFDYSEDMPVENVVSGDLFISIDTVARNAFLYKVRFKQELQRVIIHGILHLLGYKDKSSSEATLMRSKEDYYLAKLEQMIDD